MIRLIRFLITGENALISFGLIAIYALGIVSGIYLCGVFQ